MFRFVYNLYFLFMFMFALVLLFCLRSYPCFCSFSSFPNLDASLVHDSSLSNSLFWLYTVYIHVPVQTCSNCSTLVDQLVIVVLFLINLLLFQFVVLILSPYLPILVPLSFTALYSSVIFVAFPVYARVILPLFSCSYSCPCSCLFIFCVPLPVSSFVLIPVPVLVSGPVPEFVPADVPSHVSASFIFFVCEFFSFCSLVNFSLYPYRSSSCLYSYPSSFTFLRFILSFLFISVLSVLL